MTLLEAIGDTHSLAIDGQFIPLTNAMLKDKKTQCNPPQLRAPGLPHHGPSGVKRRLPARLSILGKAPGERGGGVEWSGTGSWDKRGAQRHPRQRPQRRRQQEQQHAFIGWALPDPPSDTCERDPSCCGREQ